MSPTTRYFRWQDRDTAARDLLQVAHFAPESIRRRALQLLPVFHSAVILPDLVPIVMDENRDMWERRYAIRAITSMPGDIYLPQFAPYASVEGKFPFDGLFTDMFVFASRHPSNLEWVFRRVEELDSKARLEALKHCTHYSPCGEGLNSLLCQKIIAILEIDPLLISTSLVNTLHSRDGSDTTLKWLQERWDTLIYLCLIEETDSVYMLLEGWDELREAVFKNCPAIIEEYERRKKEVEVLYTRIHSRYEPVDYQSSALWQELNGWYQAALEGNQSAYGKLAYIVYHERNNLSKRAVATNLLGKLKDKYDVRQPLFAALRYAPDDDKYQHLAMDASVRFEAGEALRDIPSPDVWETMVDAFFIRPRNVLESFLEDWIEYLTDRLSGIDTPYSGGTWGDEHRRFWFGALAEIDSTQD